MPTKPKKPDLDWSQVRETVLMLNLAVARIEGAMRDGDDSISALAELFTSIMGNVKVIGKAAGNIPDGEEKDNIQANFESASKKMNEAIVAFQFYDKLIQRLRHVSRSLNFLGDLIGDPQRLFNPYEWYGLQEMIKSKYTLDSDRAMFDAILNGATVEEAMHAASLQKEKEASEDNVELF